MTFLPFLAIQLAFLYQQFSTAFELREANAHHIARQTDTTTVPIPIPSGADLIQFAALNGRSPNVTVAFTEGTTTLTVAPITDVLDFSFVGTAITSVPIPAGALSLQITLTNLAAAPDINVVIQETSNVVVISGLFGASSVELTAVQPLSMTAAQIINTLNLVTNISRIGEEVLGGLSTASAGPTVQTTSQVLTDNLNSIIGNFNTSVVLLEASGPLDSGSSILAALDSFVAVGENYMATIGSKQLIFAQFQVTASIANALRTLQLTIDAFTFALSQNLPGRAVIPRLGTIASDKAALDNAVGDTAASYGQICIPSSTYPINLPICVSNALVSSSAKNSKQIMMIERRQSSTNIPVPSGTDIIQIISNNNAAPNVTFAFNSDSSVISIAPAGDISSFEFIGSAITTIPVPNTAKSLDITLLNQASASDINIGVEGTINSVQVSGVAGSSVAFLS